MREGAGTGTMINGDRHRASVLGCDRGRWGLWQTGIHSFYLRGWQFASDSIWHSQFLSPLLASFFAFPLSLAAPIWPCNLVLAKGLLGKTTLLFLGWPLPWINEDVMLGVTAAVLGHEVTSVKEKAYMLRLKE